MPAIKMRTLLFIGACLLFVTTIQSQVKKKPARTPINQERSYMNELAVLMLTLHPPDINRLPINITFIKKDSGFAGLIIAGHAFKSVCKVASLQMKNELDSIGRNNSSIFSFGVGFDLQGNRNEQQYNIAMRSIESTMSDLQQDHPFEVKLAYVQDSTFSRLSEKIHDNTQAAFNAIKTLDSVNRIILTYSDIRFPVPVPFYTDGSQVRFSIPKAEIGAIPKVDPYDTSIITTAINDLKNQIKTNQVALVQLKNFKPITNGPAGPPLTILKFYRADTLCVSELYSRDTANVVKHENSTNGVVVSSRWVSLHELQMACERREGRTIDYEKTKITPCEAVTIVERNTALFEQAKINGTIFLEQSLTNLKKQQASLEQFRKQYARLKKDADSLNLIDGFLRGWQVHSSDKEMNNKMTAWYAHRTKVWKHVLEQNPAYAKVFPLKTAAVSKENNIAGIFNSDDVFFSVRDKGDQYIITPYKMLGGDFVEIIDREHAVAQFLSQNNFRLIQL